MVYTLSYSFSLFILHLFGLQGVPMPQFAVSVSHLRGTLILFHFSIHLRITTLIISCKINLATFNFSLICILLSKSIWAIYQNYQVIKLLFYQYRNIISISHHHIITLRHIPQFLPSQPHKNAARPDEPFFPPKRKSLNFISFLKIK
jgi:hypothetical protein